MPGLRYKIIAMDLDGTLLDEHKQISPRTRKTLVRAHYAGAHIVVATGRSFALTRHFVGDLPLTGPQISLNGAAIVDAESGLTIFHQALPTAAVSPVIDFLSAQGIYTCYESEADIFVLYHSPWEARLVPPGTPPALSVRSFSDVMHLPAMKLVGVAEEARITALRPLAEAAFAAQLYVTRTSPVLYEFLHPSVSKGAALKKVIETLGLSAAEVIAFGDSHNDIAMLEVAGTAVAMANADSEVRGMADLIAPSNMQDGIADVLDDLLWT
jgi:Cof subfamily protein (haloacid dehalogenase superfamily)